MIESLEYAQVGQRPAVTSRLTVNDRHHLFQAIEESFWGLMTSSSARSSKEAARAAGRFVSFGESIKHTVPELPAVRGSHKVILIKIYQTEKGSIYL